MHVEPVVQWSVPVTLTLSNHKVHTPTNALFIKFNEVLKFTLKITSTCSHTFRSLSTAIITPSSEPSQSYTRLKLGKKPCCYTLWGGVAACQVMVCVLFTVLSVTLNTATSPHNI